MQLPFNKVYRLSQTLFPTESRSISRIRPETARVGQSFQYAGLGLGDSERIG